MQQPNSEKKLNHSELQPINLTDTHPSSWDLSKFIVVASSEPGKLVEVFTQAQTDEKIAQQLAKVLVQQGENKNLLLQVILAFDPQSMLASLELAEKNQNIADNIAKALLPRNTNGYSALSIMVCELHQGKMQPIWQKLMDAAKNNKKIASAIVMGLGGDGSLLAKMESAPTGLDILKKIITIAKTDPNMAAVIANGLLLKNNTGWIDLTGSPLKRDIFQQLIELAKSNKSIADTIAKRLLLGNGTEWKELTTCSGALKVFRNLIDLAKINERVALAIGKGLTAQVQYEWSVLRKIAYLLFSDSDKGSSAKNIFENLIELSKIHPDVFDSIASKSFREKLSLIISSFPTILLQLCQVAEYNKKLRVAIVDVLSWPNVQGVDESSLMAIYYSDHTIISSILPTLLRWAAENKKIAIMLLKGTDLLRLCLGSGEKCIKELFVLARVNPDIAYAIAEEICRHLGIASVIQGQFFTLDSVIVPELFKLSQMNEDIATELVKILFSSQTYNGYSQPVIESIFCRTSQVMPEKLNEWVKDNINIANAILKECFSSDNKKGSKLLEEEIFFDSILPALIIWAQENSHIADVIAKLLTAKNNSGHTVLDRILGDDMLSQWLLPQLKDLAKINSKIAEVLWRYQENNSSEPKGYFAQDSSGSGLTFFASSLPLTSNLSSQNDQTQDTLSHEQTEEQEYEDYEYFDRDEYGESDEYFEDSDSDEQTASTAPPTFRPGNK